MPENLIFFLSELKKDCPSELSAIFFLIGLIFFLSFVAALVVAAKRKKANEIALEKLFNKISEKQHVECKNEIYFTIRID